MPQGAKTKLLAVVGFMLRYEWSFNFVGNFVEVSLLRGCTLRQKAIAIIAKSVLTENVTSPKTCNFKGQFSSLWRKSIEIIDGSTSKKSEETAWHPVSFLDSIRVIYRHTYCLVIAVSVSARKPARTLIMFLLGIGGHYNYRLKVNRKTE